MTRGRARALPRVGGYSLSQAVAVSSWNVSRAGPVKVLALERGLEHRAEVGPRQQVRAVEADSLGVGDLLGLLLGVGVRIDRRVDVDQRRDDRPTPAQTSPASGVARYSMKAATSESRTRAAITSPP